MPFEGALLRHWREPWGKAACSAPGILHPTSPWAATGSDCRGVPVPQAEQKATSTAEAALASSGNLLSGFIQSCLAY